MSRLLEGKSAIVTGAAQGIGFAIASHLTEHGAKVVVADLDVVNATKAAQQIGGGAVGVAANVAVEADVQSMVDRAIAEFGSVDILVNNAGVTRDASMRKMSVDDFDLVVDVLLRGTWLGVRTAAAAMRESGGGSIINVSSLAGKLGNPGQTNYSAAKAGVIGLTKAAAKELARNNIRVNAIQPGLIRTAMTEALPPDLFAQNEAAIPMRRAGEPSEVAGPVVFLASDLSSYMTGAVLEIGGGLL